MDPIARDEWTFCLGHLLPIRPSYLCQSCVHGVVNDRLESSPIGDGQAVRVLTFDLLLDFLLLTCSVPKEPASGALQLSLRQRFSVTIRLQRVHCLSHVRPVRLDEKILAVC